MAKLPTGATTALGAYSTHSGANLPSSLTTPSGKKTSYSYDTSGNLMSSQDTTAGVSNGAKLSYGYQGDSGVADCGGFDGQRCTATDANGNKTSYSYDGQSRLSYAQENAGSTKDASWLYCYDKNGNELSAAGQLPRTGETYNDFNQLNALTTGSTTSNYTYAGTDSSYRLTADSTRIDQGPAGISTTTADGKSTGFVRDPAGTLIGMTSGGNPYYYVTDNQGAPSALVDNSGAKPGRWDYSPTGNARPGNTATVDQPFGYTGAYLDSTGLYAAGDPVNKSDPTGLYSSDDFKSDAGFVGSTA
nr:hypothetical protein [Streptomyces bauhiniae]